MKHFFNWLCCGLLIAEVCSLSLCAGDEAAFQVATAENLRSLPQSSPVTLKAKDQTLKQVLEEVSRQIGLEVEADSSLEDKKVNITAEKLPLLQVLGDICMQVGGNIEPMQSSDGMILKIDSDLPIKAFQVQGPLLFACYGLTTVKEFNFKDPQNPTPSTKYRFGIIEDPNCHVEKSIGKPMRDRPLNFVFEGGKAVPFQSDHDPSRFSSNQPDWEYLPRPELSGKKGQVQISVPILSPTAVRKNSLEWKANASNNGKDIEVTIEQVKVEKKKEFMKDIEVQEFSGTIKLIHPPAASMQSSMEAIMATGSFTPEDEKKIKAISEAGNVKLHAVALLDAKGQWVVGKFNKASGISSPVHGYRYDLKFKTLDLNFQPKDIEVLVAEKSLHFLVPFKIDGVAFDAPK